MILYHRPSFVSISFLELSAFACRPSFGCRLDAYSMFHAEKTMFHANDDFGELIFDRL
jgi:hypothetical protein